MLKFWQGLMSDTRRAATNTNSTGPSGYRDSN